MTTTDTLVLSNGMKFLRVHAGEFVMGSDDHADDEKPQHAILIPYDYWMAQFPATNELYSIHAAAKEIKHPVEGWEKKKDHPVVNVAWQAAMDYCRWLDALYRAELPAGLILRLPTEAEWEKAARWKSANSKKEDGESLEFPWGNHFDANKCNTEEGGKDGTTPVGMYSPHGDSPYGCADMSGNVWEWTHSLKRPYPYKADDGREDESVEGARTLRGGSFVGDGGYARCAYRFDYDFTLLYYNGFRVAAAPALT